MVLQGLVRILLPKEEHFFDFLERQADVAHSGALALGALRDKSLSEVSEAIQVFEHEGDKFEHQMEDALARTFVTPLDREDLHSLSSNLDSVLDLINSAARSAVLYGVDKPSPAMLALIEVIVKCTTELNAAVPHLRRHAYTKIIEAGRTIRQLEKEGDAVFRQAISALFHGPAIDARELLSEKEVLENLEEALDHCEHVADRLANLAVKHG